MLSVLTQERRLVGHQDHPHLHRVDLHMVGVGTYSEQGRNVAATVGGETITMNELAEAVSGLEKTYREVYGPAFTSEMAKTLNLKQQAVDSWSRGSSCSRRREGWACRPPTRRCSGNRFRSRRSSRTGSSGRTGNRSILSYNRVTTAAFEASKREEITLKKIEGLLAAGALVPRRRRRNCSGSRRGRSGSWS